MYRDHRAHEASTASSDKFAKATLAEIPEGQNDQHQGHQGQHLTKEKSSGVLLVCVVTDHLLSNRRGMWLSSGLPQVMRESYQKVCFAV